MTLQNRLTKLEQKQMVRRPPLLIPDELVERLADALTNGYENYDIHDVFNAWEKEQGKA